MVEHTTFSSGVFPVANAIDFNNRGMMDNAIDGSYRVWFNKWDV